MVSKKNYIKVKELGKLDNLNCFILIKNSVPINISQNSLRKIIQILILMKLY